MKISRPHWGSVWVSMRLMVIDRRRFMTAGLLVVAGGLGVNRLMAAGLASAQPAYTTAGGLSARSLYVAARKSGGRYEVAVFNSHGQVVQIVPLPDRGHSFALDPAGSRVVAFGRQPGFYAAVFNIIEGAGESDIAEGEGESGVTVMPELIEAAPGCHFFGHGVFADQGRVMAATENDYENGRGVIGIYQAGNGGNGWRRVAELDCFGVGPHEMILLPDGQTVCVANGGLLTHPDYGKLVLNRATMRPSLAYIDLASGRLLEQVFLPESFRQLSLRHLALDVQGKVWFGGQYEGPSTHRLPLVGFHRRGEPLEFAVVPDESCWQGMRNYVGSVAADVQGKYIATTSPVGGVVMIWHADSGKWAQTVVVPDGCGVAPAAAGGFLLSSGQGSLWHVTDRLAQLARSPVAWDNHIRRLER